MESAAIPDRFRQTGGALPRDHLTAARQKPINVELSLRANIHPALGNRRNRELDRVTGLVAIIRRLSAVIEFVQIAVEGVKNGRAAGRVTIDLQGPHDYVLRAIGRDRRTRPVISEGYRSLHGRSCRKFAGTQLETPKNVIVIIEMHRVVDKSGNGPDTRTRQGA